MISNRRHFLQSLTAAGALSATSLPFPEPQSSSPASGRRFSYLQMDVFTSHRLQGNALAVFPDAHGLTDEEMQAIARETNLQETTFVFPRDPQVEREHGINVRIFVPTSEVPFGGHPTLGTAMALRNLHFARTKQSLPEILLDLKVGKVPVVFREEPSGTFGEMRQINPTFGAIHDRAAVAACFNVSPDEIADTWPIQTVTTGLYFAIVPFKRLTTLQNLRLDLSKYEAYMSTQNPHVDFYSISQDTGDSSVGLRARGIYSDGEDPATGSAAGCTAAWLVKNKIAKPDQITKILQGVEIKRPSEIFVRAAGSGENINNVRVGGHAIQVMSGELML